MFYVCCALSFLKFCFICLFLLAYLFSKQRGREGVELEGSGGEEDLGGGEE